MNFESLRSAARAIVDTGGTQDDFLSENLTQPFPVASDFLQTLELSKSLQDVEVDLEKFHQDVLIAEFCFRVSKGVQLPLPDLDAIVRLQTHLSQTFLPGDSFAEISPFTQEQHTVSRSTRCTRLRAIYVVGLRLLSHLQRIGNTNSHELPVELLLCLASYSNIADRWTTQASYLEASTKLEECLVKMEDKPTRIHALLAKLLHENVKPAFAKSKNSAVTPAGRKAISALAPKFEASIDEINLKPWKYRQVHIVTVFEWILKQLDASSVESNWPLLIPPLLALLDDASTVYKIRGCSLLTTFLRVVSPQLLERTGLDEVFQEALTPCLLYLPDLTPEAESLQLLRTLYPTLLTLVRIRFPEEKDQGSKQKALDSIFRYGILKGFALAGGNVRISEFLIRRMSDIVNEMGLASCQHLKVQVTECPGVRADITVVSFTDFHLLIRPSQHILPLLSEQLADPFATAHPPLLLAALHVIRSVIIYGWPRIAHHRIEIIKGLGLCWCKTLENDNERSPDIVRVQTEVKNNVKLLTAVLEREIDVASEYRLLTRSDGRLTELLVT